jgi:hypothetical protein
MIQAVVKLTKAQEKQAEKLAATLVENANAGRAFRLGEWPRVSVAGRMAKINLDRYATDRRRARSSDSDIRAIGE